MPAPIASGSKKPRLTDKTDHDGKPARPKPNDAPVINPEADGILGRLTLQTFFILVVGLVVVTVLGSWSSIPHTAQFRYHRPVAYITSVVSLCLWYWLIARLFAKRLEIGRGLMEKREYKQAVACLEPFNSFGQHFLDRTGEAHYLLGQAYASTGNKAQADKCRQFVLKYRPGPWSAKLGGTSTPTKAAPSTKPAQSVDTPRPRPPKSKPKRRF